MILSTIKNYALAGVALAMSAIVIYMYLKVQTLESDLSGANQTIANVHGEFDSYRKNTGEQIATQKQVIVSQKQAIESGLLNIKQLKADSLKKVQTIIKLESTIAIKDKTIAAYKDSLSNKPPDVIVVDSTRYAAIPFTLKDSDEWFRLDIKVDVPHSTIRELYFKNAVSIFVGHKGTGSWFKDIFTRPVAVVQYQNENPYTKLDAMYNVTVKNPPKFYQTNAFWAGVGSVATYVILKRF